MSVEIPRAFVIRFYDDFIMLSQQQESRLQSTVRQDPDNLNGKFGYYDRIGPTAMQPVTDRHGDTPLVSTPHSRRRIALKDFDWADLIDKRDMRRMVKDGQLPPRYAQNAVWAANRTKDDLIIAAATGTAYAIDENDVATPVPLPAGQVVPHDLGGSAEGLTKDKILAAKEILLANEVSDNEPWWFVIGSKQETDLFKITETTSSDFSTTRGGQRVLDMGKLNEVRFLGFNWLRSERLLKGGTASSRQCLCYTQTAMGMALGQETDVDIGPRKDKRNSTQVYVDLAADATRIEDEKMVSVECAES